MKKLLSVILIFVMAVSVMSLSGCNQTESSATTQDNYTPDSTLRLLMVGNSYCYYYVEELYELLMENPPEGIEAVEVYNLYYPGCPLTNHLDWWREGEAKYDLFKTDATGRHQIEPVKGWSLDHALMMADWDYISLQGGVSGGGFLDENKLAFSMKMVPAIAEPLFDMFHEKFPHAQLLWHNTWHSEVGRILDDDGYIVVEDNSALYDANIKKLGDYLSGEFSQKKPYDITVVHSGVAWTKARELNKTRQLLPYGGLCARLGYAKYGDQLPHSGDGFHDGDIGGAQLLNAYMWYMTITGNHDLSGSAYIPTYTYSKTGEAFPLSPEMVDMLKEAAMSVIG